MAPPLSQHEAGHGFGEGRGQWARPPSQSSNCATSQPQKRIHGQNTLGSLWGLHPRPVNRGGVPSTDAFAEGGTHREAYQQRLMCYALPATAPTLGGVAGSERASCTPENGFGSQPASQPARRGRCMPHLAVEVSAHSLLGPRLMVELGSPLLFRVPHHIRHHLQDRREGCGQGPVWLGSPLLLCLRLQAAHCKTLREVPNGPTSITQKHQSQMLFSVHTQSATDLFCIDQNRNCSVSRHTYTEGPTPGNVTHKPCCQSE